MEACSELDPWVALVSGKWRASALASGMHQRPGTLRLAFYFDVTNRKLCHPPYSPKFSQPPGFLRWSRASLQTTFSSSRLAASRSKQSSALRQTGFIAEAFAEVFDEIQPGFGAAFQSLQNRSTLGWDSPCLILANLPARPVEQFQILIQPTKSSTTLLTEV